MRHRDGSIETEGHTAEVTYVILTQVCLYDLKCSGPPNLNNLQDTVMTGVMKECILPAD